MGAHLESHVASCFVSLTATFVAVIIKAVAAAVASYKIYIRAAFLISSLVCATLSLRRNDGGARSFSADEPAAAFLMAAPAFNYSGGIRKLFARPPGHDEDERHTRTSLLSSSNCQHTTRSVFD